MTRASEEPRLSWPQLATETRSALGRTLEGLYERQDTVAAFDALAVDKQQALLLFVRRLGQLGLWSAVRRVVNVYGEGGVGIDFEASSLFDSTLRRRSDLTRLLAARRGCMIGFRERRRPRAALHFLQCGHVEQDGCRWSVHFDLYNPTASPSSAWRHLYHESLHQVTPDWRIIKKELAD
ncbi:MAG: hypothetical protein M3R15_35015 [Acidobacteriota bacterium]|nr:hypothetical protein [Acidobacteriota bacterium]